MNGAGARTLDTMEGAQLEVAQIHAALLNNMTVCLMKQEKWARCVDTTSQVLALDPQNVKALMRRAKSYIKLKKLYKAKEDVERGLALAPTDSELERMSTYLSDMDRVYDERQKAQLRGWVDKIWLAMTFVQRTIMSLTGTVGGSESNASVMNEMANRRAMEDVKDNPLNVCGVVVPTPTLHTTQELWEDLALEDEREIKDELFYDLIFVAAIIKLSDFAKADVTWLRVAETFELFLLLWTTWLHVTFLFSRSDSLCFQAVDALLFPPLIESTCRARSAMCPHVLAPPPSVFRFTLPTPWKTLEVLLLIGTLGLALHMVEFSNSHFYVPQDKIAESELPLTEDRGGTYFDAVHDTGTFRVGLSISIIMTRLSMVAVYGLTAVFAPRSRHMSVSYLIGFGLSLAFWIAAAIATSIDEASGSGPSLWAVAIVLELLIYPVAALEPKNRVPVNIWHIMERQMLWVILILGESLISIVLPELPCECDVSVYVVVVFSLLLVYNIFQSYVTVQPDLETDDKHALQGRLLSCAFFITVLLLNVARMMHDWTPITVLAALEDLLASTAEEDLKIWDVNAALLNKALSKVTSGREGISPLELILILLILSYLIRGIEFYISWCEIQEELLQDDLASASEANAASVVLRAKTMRRIAVASEDEGYTTTDSLPRRIRSVNYFGMFSGSRGSSLQEHNKLLMPTALGRRMTRHQTALLRRLSQHGSNSLVDRSMLRPILRTHPLFSHLKEEHVGQVLEHFRPRTVKKGEVILQYQDISDSVFIVGAGMFDVLGFFGDPYGMPEARSAKPAEAGEALSSAGSSHVSPPRSTRGLAVTPQLGVRPSHDKPGSSGSNHRGGSASTWTPQVKHGANPTLQEEDEDAGGDAAFVMIKDDDSEESKDHDGVGMNDSLVKLCELDKGSVFGQLSVSVTAPSSTSIIAATDGLLWELHRKHLRPESDIFSQSSGPSRRMRARSYAEGLDNHFMLQHGTSKKQLDTHLAPTGANARALKRPHSWSTALMHGHMERSASGQSVGQASGVLRTPSVDSFDHDDHMRQHSEWHQVMQDFTQPVRNVRNGHDRSRHRLPHSSSAEATLTEEPEAEEEAERAAALEATDQASGRAQVPASIGVNHSRQGPGVSSAVSRGALLQPGRRPRRAREGSVVFDIGASMGSLQHLDEAEAKAEAETGVYPNVAVELDELDSDLFPSMGSNDVFVSPQSETATASPEDPAKLASARLDAATTSMTPAPSAKSPLPASVIRVVHHKSNDVEGAVFLPPSDSSKASAPSQQEGPDAVPTQGPKPTTEPGENSVPLNGADATHPAPQREQARTIYLDVHPSPSERLSVV
ncbi:uncharacterized protein MONBRDRAFT_36922 [Monosiga brevicollis MX1]|uniref:Cyclic nucleotide-binding domain-containing protein n=1 Tax=Monosiga brevicollis TaxID=81824 RepID=A9UYE5_MONBE|nr:uncharacterized protein MONBRDRAFT_36922 [Monosiga brevicollis MX1]EDQ89449.1 predicted protein [Monosiga brevicollis MX1]|eukprot:XP_001745478.1 hypothetical protein [Monosiga brevicollis MX1]